MAELTNVAYFTAKPGRSQDLGDELLQLVAPAKRKAVCVTRSTSPTTFLTCGWWSKTGGTPRTSNCI